MPIQKLIIIIINIVGGIAVIGSYIVGLSGKENGANALWGGTPTFVRPFYTVSMIIAALGYFAFIYFILFRLNIGALNNYWMLYMIFLGILAPSALWMPLANIFAANPGAALWMGIRIVLAVVGLSSCALAGVLISLHSKEIGLAYWLAVVGSAYFAFHTTVLDAILWPVFFKMR